MKKTKKNLQCFCAMKLKITLNCIKHYIMVHCDDLNKFGRLTDHGKKSYLQKKNLKIFKVKH